MYLLNNKQIFARKKYMDKSVWEQLNANSNDGVQILQTPMNHKWQTLDFFDVGVRNETYQNVYV